MASVNGYALVDATFGHDGTGGSSSTFNPTIAYSGTTTHVPKWNMGAANAAVNPAATFTPSIAGSELVAASDASIEVCAWAANDLRVDSQGLDALSVEGLAALTSLRCNNTSISVLDVSTNTALTSFRCYSTSISVLDVSNNTALTLLYCYSTPISVLDVSTNTALTKLYCNNTSISVLDVSNNTALTDLYCYSTSISVLDVSNNTALRIFRCENTSISVLDVSTNTALTDFRCYNTSMGISALEQIATDMLAFPITGTSKALQIHAQNPVADVNTGTQLCTDLNTIADRAWTITYDGTCAIT